VNAQNSQLGVYTLWSQIIKRLYNCSSIISERAAELRTHYCPPIGYDFPRNQELGYPKSFTFFIIEGLFRYLDKCGRFLFPFGHGFHNEFWNCYSFSNKKIRKWFLFSMLGFYEVLAELWKCPSKNSLKISSGHDTSLWPNRIKSVCVTSFPLCVSRQELFHRELSSVFWHIKSPNYNTELRKCDLNITNFPLVNLF